MKKRHNIVQFTDLQFNKINHENIFNENEEDEQNSFFKKPTDEEVKMFKERALSYGDDLVPVIHWDGECWKGFLEKGLCEWMANKDINLAWDYLAIFIYNQIKDAFLNGFEEGEKRGNY